MGSRSRQRGHHHSDDPSRRKAGVLPLRVIPPPGQIAIMREVLHPLDLDTWVVATRFEGMRLEECLLAICPEQAVGQLPSEDRQAAFARASAQLEARLGRPVVVAGMAEASRGALDEDGYQLTASRLACETGRRWGLEMMAILQDDERRPGFEEHWRRSRDVISSGADMDEVIRVGTIGACETMRLPAAELRRREAALLGIMDAPLFIPQPRGAASRDARQAAFPIYRITMPQSGVRLVMRAYTSPATMAVGFRDELVRYDILPGYRLLGGLGPADLRAHPDLVLMVDGGLPSAYTLPAVTLLHLHGFAREMMRNPARGREAL